MARCMTMAGVRPGMLIHNANTYGLFTGGHGFHQGAERIGAAVVPVSGGFSSRQATLLHDLGAQVLVATPSYALVIAQAVQEAGIDPSDARARAGPLRRRAVDRGDARRDRARVPGPARGQLLRPLRDVRPGCRRRVHGGTRRPPRPRGPLPRRGDRPRDRRSARPRAPRASWSSRRCVKEAMPFLRYRTADIGSVTREPCRCGRTTARIRGLRGRRDDMVIIRGVNVYPSNVEHALLSRPGRRSALPAGRRAHRRNGRADRAVRAGRARGRRARACAERSSESCGSSSASGCEPPCSSPEPCTEAKAKPSASSTGAKRRTPAGARLSCQDDLWRWAADQRSRGYCAGPTAPDDSRRCLSAKDAGAAAIERSECLSQARV